MSYSSLGNTNSGARDDNATVNSTIGKRRMVVLTDGHSDPVTAKTASCLLRFCSDEVVAVLDRQSSVKTSQELLGCLLYTSDAADE